MKKISLKALLSPLSTTTLCILSLFTIFLSGIRAQTAFRADAIPQSLKPYAHAVVRLSETRYTVISPVATLTTHHHVVTIMNSQGVNEGIIVVPYNKLTQVKKLDAVIYDAAGNVIKKVKMSGFEDLSMINHFSLFEDDRMKKFVPQVNTLPYTVEYEYELLTKTTFFLPSWRPQYRPGLAIEQSSCSFTTPADYELRIQTHRLPVSVAERLPSGVQKQYSWTLANLPAWRDEPFLPSTDSISAWVRFAPVGFEIDGMKGRFSTWEEYGRWCHDNLLKGRDNLPEETVKRVQKIIGEMKTPQEKARKIYEYCQQKNRYVSVQKGKVGGIRPVSAEEVDKLSYGDCKALCNYTCAMLKAAGIRTLYAEVHADSHPKSPPEYFANAVSGNHIILCLPFEGDTVWLECTNSKAPFGYLGTFTSNRKAILYDSDGGKLVRTTVYHPNDNRQISSAIFELNTEGILSGSITTLFSGTQYSNRDDALATLNTERINDLKKIYSSFPDMSIQSYTLTFDKEQVVATEHLQLESTRFATISGNRMYVPVNPVNALESLPRDVRQRTHNVCITNGYLDTDSISIAIPSGYKVESLPPPVVLNKDFGIYLFLVAVKDKRITVYRRIQMNNGLFPADKYNEIYGFLKKAFSSDHGKLVLVTDN